MEINEIFYSIQGETKDVGRPTIFVRLQFCPLRCAWCDSEKTWKKGEGYQKTIEEVLKEIQVFPQQAAICITGGEPLRQMHEVQMLISELKRKNRRRYITVETDGQEDISAVNGRAIIDEEGQEEWIDPNADSVVMDWKVPSSDMNKSMDKANLKKLRMKDQIKFIVWNEEDLKEVEEIAKSVECEILIGLVEGFPEKSGNTLSREKLLEWMKDFVARTKNPVRFQIQLHKLVGER